MNLMDNANWFSIRINICCWIMNLALRLKKNTTSTERPNVYNLSPSPEPASISTGIPEPYQTLVSQAASSMNPQAGFNVPVANMYAQSLQIQSSPEDFSSHPPRSPEQPTSQILSSTHAFESEDESLGTQYCRDNIAEDPTYQPETIKGRKRPRKNTGTGKKVSKVSKPSQKKAKGRAVDVEAQNNFINLVSHKDLDDALHVPNFPTLSLNKNIASLSNQKEFDMQGSDNIPPTRTPILESSMKTQITILPHRQVTAAEEAERGEQISDCEAQAELRIASPALEVGTVLILEAMHPVDSVEACDGNHIEAPKEKVDQLGSIREELGDLLLEQLAPDSESVSNVDYARLHQLMAKLWAADKVKMGQELGDTFQRWIDMHSKVLQFRSKSQYAGQLGDWTLHRQQLANPMERVMALKAERALKGWMEHNSKELEPHTSDLARVLCKLSAMPKWFEPDDLTGFIVTHNQNLISWLT
jgi:hypothetical protein